MPPPTLGAVKALTEETVLGEDGLIARALPGFEKRPDQLEMARAVARALAERRYLIAEAGTGTGKTLAYLVPALLSGRKVVVSTATKNLQEQIWFKDIPLLRDQCGLEFSAAYLKGRSNYYCLARGEEFAGAPQFASREEAAYWPRIQAWSRVTETGDRAELDLPDQYAAWRELSATAETCLGKECALYEDCFVTRMRMKAATADLLVVNHHLFFADLAMRTSRAGAEVLPQYDAVIFDEAHAIEDVATEYFGLQVSSYRIEELSRDVERAVADRPDLKAAVKSLTGELWKAGEKFFAGVRDGLRPRRGGYAQQRRRNLVEEDVTAPLTEDVLQPVAHEQARLDEALEAVRSALVDAEQPALAALCRRAADLRIELQAVTAMKEPSRVYFAEARGRGVFLRAAPIDVSRELQERLYKRIDTVVFTSATLAAQGRFDFFRRQVGLAPELDVDEARFEGPFDYARQAALVAPRDLPEVNDPAFLDEAAGRVEELCAITGGRAFVLCTSVRAMKGLHERLKLRLPYHVLLQGERPKSKLIEAFKAEPSVLFATASFWEGVDVPGEALSLVVIDRLPFAPPSDPVVSARVRSLEEQGRDGFSELQVPAAALALRQGFGRLIRTRTDRGLVAVLDKRLVTRGYGRAFLATLPKCPVLPDVAAARRWWG